MSYEGLPANEWEPMTPGTTCVVAGDATRAKNDLIQGDATGVSSIHGKLKRATG